MWYVLFTTHRHTLKYVWPLFFFFFFLHRHLLCFSHFRITKQRVDSEQSISRKISGMEMAAVNDAYMMSPGSLPPGSVEPQYEELERPEKEYPMYNNTK